MDVVVADCTLDTLISNLGDEDAEDRDDQIQHAMERGNILGLADFHEFIPAGGWTAWFKANYPGGRTRALQDLTLHKAGLKGIAGAQEFIANTVFDFKVHRETKMRPRFSIARLAREVRIHQYYLEYEDYGPKRAMQEVNAKFGKPRKPRAPKEETLEQEYTRRRAEETKRTRLRIAAEDHIRATLAKGPSNFADDRRVGVWSGERESSMLTDMLFKMVNSGELDHNEDTWLFSFSGNDEQDEDPGDDPGDDQSVEQAQAEQQGRDDDAFRAYVMKTLASGPHSFDASKRNLENLQDMIRERIIRITVGGKYVLVDPPKPPDGDGNGPSTSEPSENPASDDPWPAARAELEKAGEVGRVAFETRYPACHTWREQGLIKWSRGRGGFQLSDTSRIMGLILKAFEGDLRGVLRKRADMAKEFNVSPLQLKTALLKVQSQGTVDFDRSDVWWSGETEASQSSTGDSNASRDHEVR